MENRLKKSSIVNLLTITGIILFATVTGFTQGVSLDSVLVVIRKQNPMLEVYQHRANAMNAYASGSKGLMAPEVGGGLWMFPYKKMNYEHNVDTRQIMLSVQQTFTNPAKLRATEKYLLSKAAIEVAGERKTYNELKAQAKNSYYRWFVLEKKKCVLKESEEIISLMIKIAQLRYPYNQSKLSSIYKAEARLNEVNNMQLMNENEIHQQKTLLNQLMNKPQNFQLLLDSGSIPASFQIDEVDSGLLTQSRSDLLQIEQTIQTMKFNQQLENAQTKPDFNISFNHMLSVGAGMPDQFMLLGMISIPIAPWSSKMYKANSKAMDHEIDVMKSERLAILNEVQGMTTSMVFEIKTIRKQLENYEQRILPALKKNYDVLMLAYEENKEELPMVIDGWETLNMTQLQYLDTLANYYKMIVSYEKEIER